ncbi:MAG: MBL fold metallo-hydrolase [Planctomycetales bacterium]|nr:MBL fold metallo-hydrolase [Planctomycetales bacterium]
MKLVLLGTGGYHPSDLRHTACLTLPELGVVFDAGTAFYRLRDHLQTDRIDIFLTHAHLDHVIGLTFLFDVLWRHDDVKVYVHGDASVLASVREHLFAEPLFPAQPPIVWVSLEGDLQLADGARLSHIPLPHPGGSRGYRVDWPDRSLAYITDTTAADEACYVNFVRGVDLLVHECYFSDEHPERAALTGHSCTTPVARLAAAADVKRLVLVHVNPLTGAEDPIDLATARQVFPATELGVDGMEVEF